MFKWVRITDRGDQLLLSDREWKSLEEVCFSIMRGRLMMAENSDIITDGETTISIGDLRRTDMAQKLYCPHCKLPLV